MWAPICQVGKWQGMFGEVEVTHDKVDQWISAFGRNETIPVTRGHMADSENPHTTTGEPAMCSINGLMKAGDLLLGNYVNWTPSGLESIARGEYFNPSIESKDGKRLDSVALLGARRPAVDFTNDGGRFTPLEMSGCLGEDGQIILAQSLNEMALVYKTPPAKITKFFEDDKGPEAWTKAFNAAYEEYDGDEETANATAWETIKKMGYTKSDDGIYRKSKKAAAAAEKGGHEMADENAAKAAEEKQSVLAKLQNLLGIGDAPKTEQVSAAPSEPKESPEVKALAAEVSELKATVAKQKAEYAAASLMAESEKLCLAASAEPRFIPVVAQILASIPADYEVTLDETGESKTTGRQAFKNLLLAKGTAKLDDPKKLGEPPAKVEVKPLTPEGKEITPEREEEISKEARAEALAEGKGDDKAYIMSLVKAKLNAEVNK